MANLIAKRHRVIVFIGNRPFGIANVVVKHHTVPFTSCHLLIVIVGETLVFLHETTDSEAVAYSRRIVDMSHTGTGYRRIIDQLIEGILCFGGNLFLQRLATRHKRLPEVADMKHLLIVIDAWYLGFRLAPEVVF